MSADQQILIAALWQRTSGILGKARVIGLKGEPDGTPTWDIYLAPGKEQEERGESAGQPRQSASAPRSGCVQRQRRPPADEKPDPGRPFFNDLLDDSGGAL
jgi:hypothetical protein